MGPKGKPRSIGVSILLAIVTLGIYTLVWTYQTHQELKDYAGVGVGGALGLLIYLVVSPVTFFLIPNDLNTVNTRLARPSRVSALTGLWFLLPLFGPIVWFVKVQGQLNELWTTTPDA